MVVENTEVVVGVDESGTGSWVGASTVCAVAMYARDAALLRECGVDDSKRLSDERRRSLIAPISDVVLFAHVEMISVAATFTPGQGAAWRQAIFACVKGIAGLLPPHQRAGIRVIIDGGADERLRADLRYAAGVRVWFRKKADAIYPVVGAASIIAKTVRNDHMLELHREYPQYEWNQNYGYGTVKHRKLIEVHGITEYHRRVKPLLKYLKETA